MKLEEMKKIAETRTKGKWHIGHINESLDRGEIENDERVIIASDCKRNDEPFIIMAANNWDKLMAVIMAAQRVCGMNFEEHRKIAWWEDIVDALKALEQE